MHDESEDFSAQSRSCGRLKLLHGDANAMMFIVLHPL